MCVPILGSIGTKLTNLENSQKSYVLFDGTCKNGTTYVIAARILLIGISTRNKSLRLPVQKLWLKWFSCS